MHSQRSFSGAGGRILLAPFRGAGRNGGVHGFRDGAIAVTFLRHRADASGVTSVSMGARLLRPAPIGAADSVRNGCGWTTSFTLSIPAHWPSGIYSACCQDRFGGEADITFIVKADPARRSRLAVLANVNTWLAYNGWERLQVQRTRAGQLPPPNPKLPPQPSFRITIRCT